MKNKLIKIILLILAVLIVFCNCNVYAADTDPTLNQDFWKPNIVDEPELKTKAGTILGVINIIGVLASVLALSIIGIKYIFGSVEEKAEYKQALIPYIIGAVLIFSATTIPNIIFKLTSGIF